MLSFPQQRGFPFTGNVRFPAVPLRAGMDDSNGISSDKFSGGKWQFLPENPFQCNLPVGKPYSGPQAHHQRTSSDSFLVEEQPFWLEDLLNEPEVPALRVHRRSSSDSIAYLEEHHMFKNIPGSSLGSQCKELSTSFDKQNVAGPQKHDRKHIEGYSVSKGDSKSSRQHLAQRSRIRKMQYIAELERNVQALQVEGSEVSAALEFLDQQNLILGLENRALKQRLETISQEQLIKYMEHDILERELGRLHILYQQQQLQQQQQQQQQQPQKHSNRRRSKSRELESQFANLSIQHKETS